MGDVDGGHPQAGLQLDDLRARLHAQLGVKVRQRLVHEIDGGAPDDRAAHRDALALAAGEVPRLAIEVWLEVQDPRRLAHARHAFLLRNALLLEREAHVLGHGELRVQRVVLEDHRDVTVTRPDV